MLRTRYSRRSRRKPDICLLDIRMPGGGLAAAWEISARLPTTKIVMLTVSEDDSSLFGALRAGAVGYLVKDLDLEPPARALRDVAEGKAAIPRSLVARMVKQFHATDPRFRTTDRRRRAGTRLTSREWDVLAALADGLSTREIGASPAAEAERRPGPHLVAGSQARRRDREEAIAFFRETSQAS